MKIKVKEMDYDAVMALPRPKHQFPMRQAAFSRLLLKTVAGPELKNANFTYELEDMEGLEKEPCLVLMNHSSFIDLSIASKLLYKKPFHIICTSDGFVGKYGLMRNLGCIPTRKFVTDSRLVKDMLYCLKTLKSSVLMYPEASYSFDGTATPLPKSLGKCVKLLKVPVVMIRTYGAFAYDPLYNCLQKRKVDVSAKMYCILRPEQIENMKETEINHVLAENFDFDNYKWQQENHVKITEPFRADGLNRVLYKCAACNTEGKMIGKGTSVKCEACGREWELTEEGFLKALSNGGNNPDESDFANGSETVTEFKHIPDWYRWERECVRAEIMSGEYCLDIPVDIIMMVDYNAVYRVGEGRLVHNKEGFRLTGCDGRLDYAQAPLSSYSLYADYYWYELGDMICIGSKDVLYYCFPKGDSDVVAKTRLAAEELFKIFRQNE